MRLAIGNLGVGAEVEPAHPEIRSRPRRFPSGRGAGSGARSAAVEPHRVAPAAALKRSVFTRLTPGAGAYGNPENASPIVRDEFRPLFFGGLQQIPPSFWIRVDVVLLYSTVVFRADVPAYPAYRVYGRSVANHRVSRSRILAFLLHVQTRNADSTISLLWASTLGRGREFKHTSSGWETRPDPRTKLSS
jgi:hypothetical protein